MPQEVQVVGSDITLMNVSGPLGTTPAADCFAGCLVGMPCCWERVYYVRKFQVKIAKRLNIPMDLRIF